MTTDEIRKVIFRAAEMRMPRLREIDSRGQRIEALEDYLNDVAIALADLHEARLHAYAALEVLLDEWDDIEGWEQIVRSSSRITQEDIRRAKKTLRRDLHDGIHAAKRLVARLDEQIARLGGMGEDKIVSRLYTLITGA